MKLKYLGTAASEGLPALFCNCRYCEEARRLGGKNIRTRSQALIDNDLLIDFGPDTFLHTLEYEINLLSIENVLITHCHQDHFYIDDLLTRVYPFGNAQKPMHVYGNDMLKMLYQHKILKDGLKKSADKALEVVEIYENQDYQIGNYRVTPLLADHNPKEKCFIYIISEGEKSILYANDTGYFKEEVWEGLEGKYFDVVSLDCNHVEMPVYRNHMSISCCGAIKKRLSEMKCIDEKSRCVLTHFSHNHGGTQTQLEKLTENTGFLIAYDGLEIEV